MFNDFLNKSRSDLSLSEEISLVESLVAADYEPSQDEGDEILDLYMIEDK